MVPSSNTVCVPTGKIASASRMEMTTMSDLDRRRFLGAAAATVAAGGLAPLPFPLGALAATVASGQLSHLSFPVRLQAMTETLTDAPRQTGSGTDDIRPFRVNF